MKILKLFMGVGFAAVLHNTAFAQSVVVYHSPSCPHCHNARDFINKTLVAEYPDLVIEEINVSERGNSAKFMEAIKKCDLQGGYIPLVVIGNKCFQGYGEGTTVDYRAALGKVPEKVAANEKSDTQTAGLPDEQITPKSSGTSNTATALYILLGLLIIALGAVLFAKKKK